MGEVVELGSCRRIVKEGECGCQGLVFGWGEAVSLIRVKLSRELHRKFRRWAFDSGTTMQAALMGAADKLCNGDVTSVKRHYNPSILKPDEPDKSSAPSPYKFTPETCPKHYFFPGTRTCTKCGYVPPL